MAVIKSWSLPQFWIEKKTQLLNLLQMQRIRQFKSKRTNILPFQFPAVKFPETFQESEDLFKNFKLVVLIWDSTKTRSRTSRLTQKTKVLSLWLNSLSSQKERETKYQDPPLFKTLKLQGSQNKVMILSLIDSENMNWNFPRLLLPILSNALSLKLQDLTIR